MPGIFGYIKRQNIISREFDGLLDRMGEILTLFNSQEVICETVASGAFGLLGFSDTIEYKIHMEDGILVLIDGEIIDVEGVDIKSRNVILSNAELVWDLYKKVGNDLINHIIGAFTILIYDSDEERLIIFNDRFALRPLYYWSRGDTLVFAPKVKAILQYNGVGNDLNHNTLESLISVGFQLGEETLIRGIKALPQGTILTFNRDGFEIRRYSDMNYAVNENFNRRDDLEVLKDVMFRTIERYLKKGEGRLGSFLSGGYDSRLTTGLASKMEPALPVFTHPTGNDGDVEIAREVSRALGLDMKLIPLSDDYIKKNATRHTWIAEGEADATCSHFFEFMPTVQNEIDIILDGTAGDLIMGSYTDWRIVEMESREEVYEEIFFNKLNRYFPYNSMSDILSEDFFSATRDYSFDTARDLFNDIPDTPHHILLDLFYLQNYIPRWLFSGLKNIREYVEIRSPFFHYELIDYALTIPPEYRFYRKFYRKAISELLCETKDIVSTNILLPPSAGLLKLFLARLNNKLNSLLKRISGRTLRKSKYTYDYNLALQKHCGDYIRELLLSKRALNRGIFKRGFIEQTVRDHLNGKRKLMKRLGYLITIELFLRLFIDERPRAKEFDIYGNYY